MNYQLLKGKRLIAGLKLCLNLMSTIARFSVEENDDDSIENRLLAVEHAVYDQSLQIEQLEDKVTIGFVDLRNLLNDMFTQSRHP